VEKIGQLNRENESRCWNVTMYRSQLLEIWGMSGQNSPVSTFCTSGVCCCCLHALSHLYSSVSSRRVPGQNNEQRTARHETNLLRLLNLQTLARKVAHIYIFFF